MKTFKLKKGEIIYKPGDDVEGIFVIKHGKVRTYFLGQEGKDFSLEILIKNDVFGSLDGEVEEFAEVFEDCELIFIPEWELKELENEILISLISLLSKRNSFLKKRIKELVLFPLEQRVKPAILYLAERLGRRKNGFFELNLSHQELSSFLGASRECTSKILKFMEQNGEIKISRRKILVSINFFDSKFDNKL